MRSFVELAYTCTMSGDRRSRWIRAVTCAVIGSVTGLSVAGFERLTASGLLDRVMAAPVWFLPIALLLGLIGSAVCITRLGARSPSTADEYVIAFHRSPTGIPAREIPAKLLGAALTLGSGAAFGFEGPAIYLGSAIGSLVSRREASDDPLLARSLLVAGAAAGVAAVFKAPLTGAIFAIEVPFHDDHARRVLTPALVGATTGYLAFALVNGTGRLLPVSGDPAIEPGHLLVAIALGIACGIGARAFAISTSWTKRFAARTGAVRRVMIGAAAGAVVVWSSVAVLDSPLAFGSGYAVIDWITTSDRSLALLTALLVLRFVSPLTGIAGGGIGGLFIPLVLEGALLGAIAAHLIGDTTGLFPLVGVCAFLGAGYRTPLAGIAFAAEATGRPGFIIPGILATIVAHYFMGAFSVSPYQSRGSDD